MNFWNPTAFALCLPFALLAPPTQIPADEGSSEQAAPAEHESASAWWRPERGDPEGLARVLTHLVARGMAPGIEDRDVQCFAFESSILLHGPAPELRAAQSLLSELDARSVSTPRQEELAVREFALRHLTLSDAIEALRPLARDVHQRGPSGETVVVPNLSYVHARGIVVVHDSPRRVQRIEDLLARIDVPRPQLRVSAWLIRGAQGDDDPSAAGEADGRIPAEAMEGLAALVPYDGFELVSFALLRSDGTSEMAMTDARDGIEYRMVLDPESFDAQAKRLTLARCALDILRVEGTRRTTRSFTTAASLTAGEYVVLGGVGADADFLVLRMAIESDD